MEKMNGLVAFVKSNKGLFVKGLVIIGGAVAAVIAVGALKGKEDGSEDLVELTTDEDSEEE